MKDIVQMEHFDIHHNHILSSKFVFNNSEYIDYEWILQVPWILILFPLHTKVYNDYYNNHEEPWSI